MKLEINEEVRTERYVLAFKIYILAKYYIQTE